MKKLNCIKLKDILIYSLILFCIIVIGHNSLKDIPKESLLLELSSYIGTIVIILFGFVGIFDFAYTNGLYFLVPSSYEKHINKKYNKIITYGINNFVNSNFEYLNQYDNTRISLLLNQLGISQNDFNLLKIKIIEIKMLPLKTLSDAKVKLKKIINNNDIIIKQDEYSSNQLVYKKVKYFINLTNISYIDDYCNELVDILIMLIKETIPNELNHINKIIIPYNSNRLLGLGTAKQLGKSVVNVTQEPKIFKNECWEGVFDKTYNEGIIVHDVLVTGEQIIKSLDKINTHCTVKYIFCLINRTDNIGKKEIESKGYKVFSVLDIHDDQLINFNNEHE